MSRLDELLVSYPKGMRSELENLLVARVAELEKQVAELQDELRRVEEQEQARSRDGTR